MPNWLFVFFVIVALGVAMTAVGRWLTPRSARYPWCVEAWATGIAIVVMLPLCCHVSRADSIEAEEIEVPAPEWSILYEEPPALPALPDYASPPVELMDRPPPEESEASPWAPASDPPRVVVVPDPCLLPFVSCGDDDGGRWRKRARRPNPPAVPEPSAALLFAAGLLLLRRRTR